jgi:hypothetical protein
MSLPSLAHTFHFQKLRSIVDLTLMFSFSHLFFCQAYLHPQQMGVLKERSQKALGPEWKSQEDDGTQGGDNYCTAITLADLTPRRTNAR